MLATLANTISHVTKHQCYFLLHLLPHSFSKYIVSVFPAAGAVPGTGDINVSTEVFAFMAFMSSSQEEKQ